MRYFTFFFILLGIIASGEATADEVVFKNGERVTGKVTQLLDGKIKIASDTLGSVSASLDSIVKFSTGSSVEIHFQDGSIFNQKIAAHQDGLVKIAVGPDLTPTEFKIADITKINPPKVKWTGSLSAGASITRGNSYT